MPVNKINRRIESGCESIEFKIGTTRFKMEEIKKGKRLRIKIYPQAKSDRISSFVETGIDLTFFTSRLLSKNWWLWQLNTWRVEKDELAKDRAYQEKTNREKIQKIDELIISECPELLEEQLLGE